MSEEHLFGHMVHERYVARMRAMAEDRAATRAKVRTRKQLDALQRSVRRKLRAIFGRFPARTPLNARVTGVLERPSYTIEKVIYESRPAFPVTANLYVPRRGRAPYPAVLGVCGHSEKGKAEVAYQAFSQNLARMGYVVLIYDPISQGERRQYLGVRGKYAPKGCCSEHTMAGNQMSLLGDFFGLWRVWDGIRGLDYLLSRPEVDRTRVGVTGNSGGGTLSTYLTALDPRFTMAAPSCFVTTYLCNCENELPADSEQIPPGMVAAGLDMADFFVAYLPRPTILLGQNNDYFDRRGLEATYEELRRLYGVAGAPDAVRLFVGPTNHGYSVHNRQAMYRFFNARAGVEAPAREPRSLKPERVEALAATPRGEVHFLKPRRVFDFTADKARAKASARKRPTGAALSRAMAKRLGLPKRPAEPRYRVIRPRRPNGSWNQNRFLVETEPGLVASLHAFSKRLNLMHLPPGSRATVYVPHLSSQEDLLAGLAPKAEPLWAVDVRGMGQMAVLSCPSERCGGKIS